MQKSGHSSVNPIVSPALTFVRAFRHRDYFVFWSGLFLGHTGTLMQTTAQSWLLFQLTNSLFYLGVKGFCLELPRVICAAFGERWLIGPIAKLSSSLLKLHFYFWRCFLA